MFIQIRDDCWVQLSHVGSINETELYLRVDGVKEKISAKYWEALDALLHPINWLEGWEDDSEKEA